VSNPLWMEMRPRSLEEFLGNDHAVKVAAAITGGAVLIHGPMGCGKTSLAFLIAERILKNSLPFCEGVGDGISGGFHYYLASKLTAKMVDGWCTYTGHRRTIVLDEAQALSEKLQTKLHPLIDLEWPGKEDTLIFCTTDPNKLTPPLRTRCRIIPVVPLSDEERAELVERGWHKRKSTYDPPRDLLAALKEYNISIPRLISQVVDDVADGVSPRESARAVATAIRPAQKTP